MSIRFARREAETVFISGRWLEDYVEPSLVSLRNAGISDPKLVIGNDRHPSLFPPAAALSDAKVKVQHQLKIEELYGLPVAIIDDRAANRAAIIDAVNPECVESPSAFLGLLTIRQVMMRMFEFPPSSLKIFRRSGQTAHDGN